MGGKNRFIISCLGENTEVYHERILALIRTLKHFGGTMAKQKTIVYFNGAKDPKVEQELIKLGVTVQISKPFDVRSPHSNKVRMLEIDEERDYDVLLILDCDLVIAQDFVDQILNDRIQAAPVYIDFLTNSQWRHIFSVFDLRFPKKKMETFLGEKTVPYYNSGVIAIPRKYVRPLRELWKKYIKLLLDQFEGKLNDIAEKSYFTDQIALTLALQEGKFPFTPFPLEMNFQINQSVHEKFSPDLRKPYIIHYHKKLINNKIRKTGYKNPDRFIRKLNRFLRRG
ncbi:hypothetical protein [Ammoniphilus sp. YIM 78166]|uniref:hypothetical protein n=1 Tax=Ammoniphilus sp. YIM 78166 TaxID=1644106 RepID=UPI00106F7FE2|nr:hypothetical protein [Ammoniphilus sp. YIM 78166]